MYTQQFTTVANCAVKSLAFYSGKNDQRDRRSYSITLSLYYFCPYAMGPVTVTIHQ